MSGDATAGSLGLAPPGDEEGHGALPLRERVLRRFAGAGVAVLVVGVPLTWAKYGWFVAVGVLATYLVGVPVSLWIERRRCDGAGVLGRHLVAGLWTGGVVGFLVYPVGFLITATVGAGVGAVIAVLAAAVGLRLPRRVLWPVALLAPALLVLATSPQWWSSVTAGRTSTVTRTPVVVETVPAADVLGDELAAAVEVRAAAGEDRLADGTWDAVTEEVIDDEDLEEGSVSLLLDPDGSLPVLRSTGEPARLVTVHMDRPSSWLGTRWVCLQVTREATEVSRGACEELDLVEPGA